METNLGQVVLVKDIRPGIRGSTSFLNSFALFNNKLYFSAFDGVNGSDLWVTDGTTAGTRLVKETNSSLGFNPDNLTVFNNKLYFSANDEVNGTELWVSDGTNAGTQLVKDINPGSSNGYPNQSFPNNFTKFNNKLYFSADDGVNGRELWVTDGTSGGTQLVKDINPGTNANGPNNSSPYGLTEFNNKLYFSATNANGSELWVSDGTTNGTRLLKNINPGAKSSAPTNFTEFNNKLYFVASNEISGREIWVTDGTSAGTQLLKDIFPGSTSYISYYSNAPSNLTVFNNKLYFNANNGLNNRNNRQLWVSDGTTTGTQLITDLIPYNGFDPTGFTEFNNKLYFATSEGLWVSDGTTAGTQLLKSVYLGFGPSGNDFQFTEFNGKLYFSSVDDEPFTGTELWVTDGTTAGTQLVADINLGRNSSDPFQLTVVGDELLFIANNGISGRELFKLTFDRSGNLVGTNSADNLNGTDSNNIIEGLNGNDTLSGLAGNDTLLGGNSNDILVGDLGNDSLAGGSGRDNLTGGNGNDILTGGDGNDTLDGGAGTNILSGGANNDLFILRSGIGSQDLVDFQDGIDKLGLAGGLEFDDLTFTTNRIRFGTDDLLATINFDVNVRNLTEADFVVV
jgi:ELWxxDGT repeat protein